MMVVLQAAVSSVSVSASPLPVTESSLITARTPATVTVTLTTLQGHIVLPTAGENPLPPVWFAKILRKHHEELVPPPAFVVHIEGGTTPTQFRYRSHSTGTLPGDVFYFHITGTTRCEESHVCVGWRAQESQGIFGAVYHVDLKSFKLVMIVKVPQYEGESKWTQINDDYKRHWESVFDLGHQVLHEISTVSHAL